MEKSINRFLEFNGQTIYFLAKDTVYWVAVRPICDAIGIDYDSEHKRMKADKILGPALQNQPAGEKAKNLVCLPEFFVYGWIFSIQGKSKGLHDYQWKCYELLYNHFHGQVGNRKDRLSELARIQIEQDKLLNDLEKNPEYIQFLELEERKKKINKNLKSLDKGFFKEQLTLFSTS